MFWETEQGMPYGGKYVGFCCLYVHVQYSYLCPQKENCTSSGYLLDF